MCCGCQHGKATEKHPASPVSQQERIHVGAMEVRGHLVVLGPIIALGKTLGKLWEAWDQAQHPQDEAQHPRGALSLPLPL